MHTAEFLDHVTYGDILTGGSVLSSFEEKDKICLGYTKADFVIGGEMEGNAVFQTAKRTGIPGAVIKGICDWGVAKNDIYLDEAEKNESLNEALEMEEKLKDSLQAFAMKSAVAKCSLLVKDRGLFSAPKNENVECLRKQCKTARYMMGVTIITQILIFMASLFFLFSRYVLKEISVGVPVFIFNPFIWFFGSLGILIVCLGAIKTSFKLSDRQREKKVEKIIAQAVHSGSDI